MSKDVSNGKRRWAIYKARKKRNLTLMQVARLAFVSYETVLNYESARRTPKQKRAWESFDAICEVLNLTREEALVVSEAKAWDVSENYPAWYKKIYNEDGE